MTIFNHIRQGRWGLLCGVFLAAVVTACSAPSGTQAVVLQQATALPPTPQPTLECHFDELDSELPLHVYVETISSEDVGRTDAMLCLKNTDAGLIDLSVTLSQNADLVLADESGGGRFTVLGEDDGLLRFNGRLDVGDTRQVPFTIRSGMQDGIIRVGIDVEVDGNPVPDASSQILITEGDLSAFRTLSIPLTIGESRNNEIVSPQVAELSLLMVNTADQAQNLQIELRTFSALSFEAQANPDRLSLAEQYLYPGEARVFNVPIFLRPDQPKGRYTVAVDLQANGLTIDTSLVPVGDGRNTYDPPLGADTDPETGIYVEAIAIPETVSSGRDSQAIIAVWVENLLTTPDMREFEVAIRQTSSEVRFLDADSIDPSSAFVLIELGPQEGQMIEFTYSTADMTAGARQFGITVNDRTANLGSKTSKVSVDFTE